MDTRIKQHIDDLRVDIQALIDKKKKNCSKDEMIRIDDSKKVKIDELKKLTVQLRDMQKEERAKIQKVNEIRKTGSAVNSIEFHAVKKRGGDIDNVKKDKQKRDEAKNRYLEYLDLEEKYNKLDPQSVPGFMFLHERVLNEYGLCPHIAYVEDTTSENIQLARKTWLNETKDEGQLYYDLYTNIIECVEVKELIARLDGVVSRIDSELQKALTPPQFDLYKGSYQFMEQYKSSHVKTKKIKETYAKTIHNLSIIFCETKIKVHEYLSCRFNEELVVNFLERPCDKLMSLVNAEKFDALFSEFRQLTEQITQKRRFNTNTVRNLKNNMYLLLSEQKTFGQDSLSSKLSNKSVKQPLQVGKYFTRWIHLTPEQKDERFKSYALFHIDRHLKNIELTEEEKRVMSEKLGEMLTDAYNTKKMIYRDFKWVTKKGLIENVKIIHFNNETRAFTLKYTNHAQMKAMKKAAQKTVFTKGNENLINEEILNFVLEQTESLKDTTNNLFTEWTTKFDLDKCWDRLKTKLKLKKLPPSDMQKVLGKIDEMIQVISQNPQ